MIERIIIENFKSIRKLDLELKPINILVGANGAGKSNFVSFFKLTNQTYNYKLDEYIGDNIDSLLRFGRKNSDYIYGFFDFDNSYAISFKIIPTRNKNTGFKSGEIFLKNQLNDTEKNYQTWKILYQDNSNLDELDKKRTDFEYAFGKAADRATFFLLTNANLYFDAFKTYHFQDTGNSSPLKQINKLDDNDYLREDGANLAAFLYYLQEKHPKEFKNIEDQIRSVAPFFDRFNLSPRKLNEEEIRLRWFEKGADSYFDAFDLSDGTLRFMALATLLLQPDLPKTIIIDEPELGLHPFAINKLAAMMKQAAAKGSQVIVSTQSVGLIDNFEPEDIITVDREDDQSVFRRLDSDELKDWLEDYTLGELWNKNVIGARS